MSANSPKNPQILDSPVTALESPRAAYLHIPFCRRRCFYCDFPISVVGDRQHGDNSNSIEQYVEAIAQEIAVTPALDTPLDTVFFGGGTPSLLSANQLDRLLKALANTFGLVSGVEISMEMDPGTFDRPQLQGYRWAGINRVSLGVQAFQDQLLQACGRSHSVSDIYEAIELLHQVDVANFSLDLISGLPHQTLEMWQHSLDTAVEIAPVHLSLYDLIVEPRTVFDRDYQPGVQPLPSDETAAQMYRLAQQTLTQAGYEHYEISNYAQPGSQCRHNRTYWQNRSYYGFGMGAASYVGGQRFTRPRTKKAYYQWLEDYVAAGAGIDCPPTPEKEVQLETLMLGFRLAEGLSLATLTQEWGIHRLERIWQALQPYYQQGWVEAIDGDGTPIPLVGQTPPTTGRLRLSDPEGFLFSNTILAALFSQF